MRASGWRWARWVGLVAILGAGCAGDPGEPGAEGAPGAKGDKGDPGAPGEDGDPGTDGVNGRDGLDGKDGAKGQDGAKGTDGTNGKDGHDGADGLCAHATRFHVTGLTGVSDDTVARGLPTAIGFAFTYDDGAAVPADALETEVIGGSIAWAPGELEGTFEVTALSLHDYDAVVVATDGCTTTIARVPIHVAPFPAQVTLLNLYSSEAEGVLQGASHLGAVTFIRTDDDTTLATASAERGASGPTDRYAQTIDVGTATLGFRVTASDGSALTTPTFALDRDAHYVLVASADARRALRVTLLAVRPGANDEVQLANVVDGETLTLASGATTLAMAEPASNSDGEPADTSPDFKVPAPEGALTLARSRYPGEVLHGVGIVPSCASCTSAYRVAVVARNQLGTLAVATLHQDATWGLVSEPAYAWAEPYAATARLYVRGGDANADLVLVDGAGDDLVVLGREGTRTTVALQHRVVQPGLVEPVASALDGPNVLAAPAVTRVLDPITLADGDTEGLFLIDRDTRGDGRVRYLDSAAWSVAAGSFRLLNALDGGDAGAAPPVTLLSRHGEVRFGDVAAGATSDDALADAIDFKVDLGADGTVDARVGAWVGNYGLLGGMAYSQLAPVLVPTASHALLVLSGSAFGGLEAELIAAVDPSGPLAHAPLGAGAAVLELCDFVGARGTGATAIDHFWLAIPDQLAAPSLRACVRVFLPTTDLTTALHVVDASDTDRILDGAVDLAAAPGSDNLGILYSDGTGTPAFATWAVELGAPVPAGKTRLRFINLVPGAPIDVTRADSGASLASGLGTGGMIGPVETPALIGYPFAPGGELQVAIHGEPVGKTTVESQHLVDLVVVTAPWFRRFASEVEADFSTLWFDYSDAGSLLSRSSYWLGTWFPLP